MFLLPIGVGFVAGGDGLVQILDQVIQPPVGLVAVGEHALDVDLGAEPDHLHRLRRGRTGFVERGQRVAGVGVDIPAGVLVPDREVYLGVDDGVGLGRPHLVVGRGGGGADVGAGDGAPDRRVQVRGQAALGFGGGEVLHVEPATRRRF